MFTLVSRVIVAGSAAMLLAAAVIWRTSSGVAVEAGDAAGPTGILVPATFAVAGSGMSPPVAYGDRLLVFRRTVASPSEVALKVRDVQTGREWTSAFWTPGASAIRIETAALTPDGHALIGGLATSTPAGAARLNGVTGPIQWAEGGDGFDEDMRSFTAEIDGSGRVLKIIDFGTYVVQRLCASDDGTFWTIGRDWKHEHDADSAETYDLVRHYSARGEMVSHFLPRQWLRPALAVGNPDWARLRAAAFLACGQRSIVAYLAGPAGSLVVEIDPSSRATRSRHVVRVPGVVMSGLAVLADNSVHAVFATPVRPRTGERAASTRPDGGGAATDSGSAPGLYTLDANSRPAVWHPSGESRRNIGLLIGADGERLVLWRRESALADGALVLIKPRRLLP